MKTIKYLLIIILFNTGFIYAQTVDEIVDKHIEALGGADKLEGLKTIHSLGKATMMGMDASFEIYVVKPDRVKLSLNIMESKIIQALDGETGWMINPMMGDSSVQDLKPSQLKELKNQSEFEGKLFKYKDKGTTVTLEGKEDVDNKPAYKLKIIDKEGDSSFYFIDKESYLNVKRINYRVMQGQTVTIETVQSEFKTFDGIKVATVVKTTSDMAMMNRDVTIEKIELNKKIDKNIFKKPK
jgi:hypothetical protein